MSERTCIRGCTQRGVHYASCDGTAPDGGACWGCAERECREGSLICDRCFGRMRALLADGPDLLGRICSLADPMKATPTDKAPGGRSSSVEAPAPVDADLLDAIAALEQLSPWWHVTLSDYSNDLTVITWLGEVVLDVHPEVAGERPAWSVADAMAKWGVERRTKGEPAWSPAEEIDPARDAAVPIPEWGDPIVGWADAVRIAGSDSTLRRWIKREEIDVAGTFVIAGIPVRQFRREELIATRERLSEKKAAGLVQNQTTEHDAHG